MKTLNFDLFENYQLSIEEMISVRGGDPSDGEPTPIPPPLPIRV
jgi:hypothetical protein